MEVTGSSEPMIPFPVEVGALVEFFGEEGAEEVVGSIVDDDDDEVVELEVVAPCEIIASSDNHSSPKFGTLYKRFLKPRQA